MNLRDKVIVITGASSGFGEAIARRCSDAGARVVLAARSAERLEQLANELGTRRTLAAPTDVTCPEQVARLAAATTERFGPADVLIANAGFGIFDRVADAPLGDLQAMLDVNLIGTVSCIKAFLPAMLQRRSGHVVVMASLAGLIAAQNMGYYASTKFALVGLTRALLLELHGTGVRCALICPGVAPTGFQVRADPRKFARITGWANCSVEQVTDATLRAIRRRTHGEVLVPRYARLLAALSSLLPGPTRAVHRIVG